MKEKRTKAERAITRANERIGIEENAEAREKKLIGSPDELAPKLRDGGHIPSNKDETGAPAVLVAVNKSKWARVALKTASHIISLCAAAVFAMYLYSYYKVGLTSALLAATLLAVPYFAVTLLRYFLDAKRPYEVYNIYEKPPKSKRGKSFPSRHVFSAFLIGTAAISAAPVFASILLGLSVLLGVCRVLLGVHFTRDCIAGALMGIVCGAIALLIL